MNIVLEGPDNSGKSTLGRYLSIEFDLPLIASEGPEKFPGEINERVRRYLIHDNVIFDRHPCVSQMIYYKFNKTFPVDKDLILRFHDGKPLFIFCCPLNSLKGHNIKAHDTKAHLKMVEEYHREILEEYYSWARNHALIWYRIGQPFEIIRNLLKGVLYP